MTDYSKFDAELLAAIKSNEAVTMSEMLNNVGLSSMAARIASPTPLPRIEYHASGFVGRVFDRRLQALRRAGKIRYSGTKWEVAC